MIANIANIGKPVEKSPPFLNVGNLGNFGNVGNS
jgi:hypothetical protein